MTGNRNPLHPTPQGVRYKEGDQTGGRQERGATGSWEEKQETQEVFQHEQKRARQRNPHNGHEFGGSEGGFEFREGAGFCPGGGEKDEAQPRAQESGGGGGENRRCVQESAAECRTDRVAIAGDLSS